MLVGLLCPQLLEQYPPMCISCRADKDDIHAGQQEVERAGITTIISAEASLPVGGGAMGLEGYLVSRGEGPLGTLCFPPQLLEGPAVLLDVNLVLALDQLDEVIHDAVVEILASQVSVSAGRDDLREIMQTLFASWH